MLEQLDRDFTMTVERVGQRMDFHYNAKDLGTDDPRKKFGLVPVGYGGNRLKAVIASTPADRIHLLKGDVISKVNDVPIGDETSLVENIGAHPKEEITITWKRNGVEMSSKVTPDESGHIGVNFMAEPFQGRIRKIDYSVFEAVPVGLQELVRQTKVYLKGIGMLFSGKVDLAKNVGGPIKIAQFANQAAEGGAASFFGFMAILSLSLAFLNILPIPALDGGHLVIILIEAILGRELTQGFKLGFQKVGVTILLLLMAFMVFNDIRGL